MQKWVVVLKIKVLNTVKMVGLFNPCVIILVASVTVVDETDKTMQELK